MSEPTHWLKLTGAAIPVFRASMSLHATPAAWPSVRRRIQATMKTPGTYMIRGGVEGQKRLEVLARVLWLTTSRLLAEAGLAPGIACLDLGCGGGQVTLRLA